jgi:hypothetical protein
MQLYHSRQLFATQPLYRLNDENKYFINARCSETCEEAIKPYRLLVQQFIAPDIQHGDERIEKAKARKTINDYWKAVVSQKFV